MQQQATQQSAVTQDRQSAPADDITRRDLARFDQFLDSHREIAEQLRRTPSLIDDPQYLQGHPDLSAYLQDHPGVKQEISQQPGTFMQLEDRYDHDRGLRDRDASGQDQNAFGQDRDRDAHGQNSDADHRDGMNRDAMNFERFLDDHREIGEQVRKDPSLLDNRDFVKNHPALDSYLRDNPGVRDQIRQNPGAFLQQSELDNRDWNMRDHDGGLNVRDRDTGTPDRDADRREAMNFDRFLDDHREIGEQVRKNPSLLDNRDFVKDHPALQSYLQDNAGVRDQIRQNPGAFMQQADLENRNWNGRDRDAMQDRMADFRGFLGSHPDIQKDMARDPSCVKDPRYVQEHAELNVYLNAHPDVRDGLMANPDSFVHGTPAYGNGSASGTASGNLNGAGVNSRTTGTAGSSTGAATTGTATSTTTGTSTNAATSTTHPKPQ